MKKLFFLSLLLLITTCFSQQRKTQTLATHQKEIEIFTEGLDNITLINSKNNQIEVSLFNENMNSNDVSISEKENSLKIRFEGLLYNSENVVFRKFITKRLHRSYAVLKIPKNKRIIVYGTNVDVISKNYQGDLAIYIDKGVLKFNMVRGNIILSLYQGTVYATISNHTNIYIQTNKGSITTKGKKKISPFVKLVKNSSKKFIINSINANVILNSL